MTMPSPLRAHRVAACMILAIAVSNPAYSQTTLSEGIQELATQISSNVSKEHKRKIAILPFRELDGKPTVLSTFIPEELMTHLFASGSFEIVERSMLDRLLGEIKLEKSGFIDPEMAKKVGKIASVDAIVTGSVTDLRSYVAINCRLIDTQTGRIFGAAQAKIKKDEDLLAIMRAPLPSSTGVGMNASPQPDRQASKPAAPELLRVRVADHVFELKRCTRSGDSLQCDILITNEGADRKIFFSAENSRLIDEDGTGYRAVSLTLKGGSSTKVMTFGNNRPPAAAGLPSGVPVKAVVIFEGIPSSTERAALIEIQEESGGFYGGRGLKAQFRNVTLPTP